MADRFAYVIKVACLLWCLSGLVTGTAAIETNHTVDCSELEERQAEGLSLEQQISLYASRFVSRPQADYVGLSAGHLPIPDEGTTGKSAFSMTDLERNSDCPFDRSIMSASFRYLDNGEVETVNIKVTDNEAPSIYNIPTQPDLLPYQVQCAQDAVSLSIQTVPRYAAHIHAVDNCLPAPPVIHRWTYTQHTCVNHGLFVLHWVADDGCRNTRTVNVVVRVMDTEPPIVDPKRDAIRYCVVADSLEKPVAAHRLAKYLIRHRAMIDNCDKTGEALNVRFLETVQQTCTIRGCVANQHRVYDSFTFPDDESDVYPQGTLLQFATRVSDSCGNEYPHNVPIELFFGGTKTLCAQYKLPVVHINGASESD